MLRWGMSAETYRKITGNRFGSGNAQATGAAQAVSDDDALRLWGFDVVLCNEIAASGTSGDAVAVFGHFGRAVRVRRVTQTAISDLSPDAFVGDFAQFRVVTRFDSRAVDTTAAVACVVK